MTISNSNLLSILTTGTDVTFDGLMTGQLSEQATGQTVFQSVDGAAFDKAFVEGDFWSMLNQQLVESSENEAFKGFENKDYRGFDNKLLRKVSNDLGHNRLNVTIYNYLL